MATNALLDLFMNYEFVIHAAKDGGFFWTYRNVRGNTEPICWSETYTTKQSCQESIQKVKSGAATAQIRDTTASGLLR